MNDTELISAISRLEADNRDPHAWEDLYRSIFPYLLAVCFHSVHGNRYLAEEVLQETMLRLIRSFDFNSGNPTPASLTLYLRSIVRSVVIDLFRVDKSRMETISSEDLQDQIETTIAQVSGFEEDAFFQVRLREVLEKMKERERTIVQLLMEGKTVTDIAETLKISEKTASNLISMARKQLRSLLFH